MENNIFPSSILFISLFAVLFIKTNVLYYAILFDFQYAERESRPK